MSTDWQELDETGMHVHVRMGLTANNEGPAEPPGDPDFDHWGCWCADASCPGPPSYCEDVACPSKQRCTDPDCSLARERM